MAKALVLATLLLAACQTTGGSFCDIAEPIRPTAETLAAMSQAEIDAAVAHNLKGQELCGWKP